MLPKVVIIILNWNGWEDTVECLESLYQIDYPDYEVILVDNGSTNSSIRQIKEYANGMINTKSNYCTYDSSNKPIKVLEYSEEEIELSHSYGKWTKSSFGRKLIILKNKKNYGFSEGNNIGIRFALKNINFRYILLLNNDTVVEKNFLYELVITGEKSQENGIIGSKILYYYNPSIIQFNGKCINYKNLFLSRYTHPKKTAHGCESNTVKGCSMLIKKNVIKNIGALDPDYFAYGEEEDYCIRAMRAGYKIIYSPTSKVYHKGGGSTGGGFNKITAFLRIRNIILLYRKNFPLLHLLLLIPYLVTFIIYHTIFAMIARKYIVINSMIKGLLWHVGSIKKNNYSLGLDERYLQKLK